MITDEQIKEFIQNPEAVKALIDALVQDYKTPGEVFTEEECKNDFEVIFTHYLDGDGDMEEITQRVHFSDLQITGNFLSFSSEEKADRFRRKIFAMQKWGIVADYLNDGWVPDYNNKEVIKVSPVMKKSEIKGFYCWERIAPFSPLKSEELFNRAKEIMGEEAMKDMFL